MGGEFREFSRVNGWSYPPHPLQIVAWCVVVWFMFCFYGTMCPSVIVEIQIVLYIIISIMLSVEIVFMLIASTLDPADHYVRQKLHNGQNTPMPKFDRDAHSHVIENFYCNLCQVPISNNLSKHCSSCNKCVATFDHHCIWLNNCVGIRNYKYFMGTLISAALGIFTLGVVSLLMLLGYFVDINKGHVMKPYKECYENVNCYKNLTIFTTGKFKVIYLNAPDGVYLFILLSVLLLAVAALVPIFQLIHFHRYLKQNKLTTYQYVKQSKDSSSGNTNNAIINPGCSGCRNRRLHFKAQNTVVPMNSAIESMNSTEGNFRINNSSADNFESRINERISKNDNSTHLSNHCQSTRDNDMVKLTTADDNLSSLVSIQTKSPQTITERNGFVAKLDITLCAGDSQRSYQFESDVKKTKSPPSSYNIPQPIISDTTPQFTNPAIMPIVDFRGTDNSAKRDSIRSIFEDDPATNWRKPDKRLPPVQQKSIQRLKPENSVDESIDCSLFSTNSSSEVTSNCSTVLDNDTQSDRSVTPVPSVITIVQNIGAVSSHLPSNDEIFLSKAYHHGLA